MTPAPPRAQAGSRDTMLQVSGLTAGYRGRMVVDDVSLSLSAGEVVGLVGHNGSGKSTVLLGLAGLAQHTASTILVCGQECSTASARRRKQVGMGILLQRGAVFPDLSVEMNLRISGGGYGALGESQGEEELSTFASNIVGRSATPAGALSGGERRILGLLMAASSMPKCFLVDEPTLGLSRGLELAVFEFLRSYARKYDSGVIVVSHNLHLVERKCDRAYIIREGGVAQDCRCGAKGADLKKELNASAR